MVIGKIDALFTQKYAYVIIPKFRKSISRHNENSSTINLRYFFFEVLKFIVEVIYFSVSVRHALLVQGSNVGEGARPPPAFHTLAWDMALMRGETHLTLGLGPCIISSSLL